MNTDGKKPGSELDNIIEKLGLEEVEQNTLLPEETQEGDNLIDLNIIEDEINSKKSKSKKVKKLNLSIIVGGILIVVMLVVVIILKSCSSSTATGTVDLGTTGVFDGQGTTAGNIDRPENVTKAVISDNSDETVNPSVR